MRYCPLQPKVASKPAKSRRRSYRLARRRVTRDELAEELCLCIFKAGKTKGGRFECLLEMICGQPGGLPPGQLQTGMEQALEWGWIRFNAANVQLTASGIHVAKRTMRHGEFIPLQPQAYHSPLDQPVAVAAAAVAFASLRPSIKSNE